MGQTHIHRRKVGSVEIIFTTHFFGAFNFVKNNPHKNKKTKKKHIVSNFRGGVALFIWFATC